VNIEILPLAITMMIGPGIMAAIIFVTHERAVQVSLAFVAGIAISVTLGVAVATGILSLLGDNVSLGDPADRGSAGTIIQVALVALLAASAVKNYVRRETIEPPKWMGALLSADTAKAFRTGLLLIPLMPSDVIIMLTVATNIEQTDSSLVDALPFVALTVLVAALPLLAFLLFHRRAHRAMPKVRDWMNANSWLVNIIVCVVFILLIL
jgi:cytochrome c biogenesis protein CcdA